MIDITALADTLHARVEWQKTPEEVYQDDLAEYILLGIKDLFIMTGRAMLFSNDSVTYEDDIPVSYDSTLMVDEQEYVLIVAQVAFFSKVKTDVNKHVGYTTDALSVTHADKPYRYLSETIADLEHHKRMLWFKMARYNI